MHRQSRPVVTLTTDFGLADPYVAAMKGVVLGLNSEVTLVDVSHDIGPRALLQATFVTQAAWPAFADGTVHLVVVDPGVGGDRRALVIETPRGLFVGPDNGALSAALPDAVRPTGQEAQSVGLPDGVRAFSLTDARYVREPVSATFHGRDIFAPVAAHLTLGVVPEELGEPVDAVFALPPLRAPRCDDGGLDAHVVHIDRFGNVITDARADDLAAGAFTVKLGQDLVRGPVRTYGDASGLVALVGSAGYLEIALSNGNAAEQLGAAIGDAARLRPEG